MNINSSTGVYSQIASGNRITSAAQDPAGLAISEKLQSQISGDNKAIDNIASSQNLLNTADGALENIQGDLGRIRELAVQANNGIYTADDRKNIQFEIDSLLENIQTSTKNTEFNTMKLLDGSFSDKNLGAGANGQGTTMSIQNTSLESLGLSEFSVVDGEVNLDAIDNAISKVSESRSNIGAKTNGLQSRLNNTQVSEYNQSAAKSTIADIDIAKAVMDLNKEKSLNQYKILLQQRQMETEQEKLGILL